MICCCRLSVNWFNPKPVWYNSISTLSITLFFRLHHSNRTRRLLLYLCSLLLLLASSWFLFDHSSAGMNGTRIKKLGSNYSQRCDFYRVSRGAVSEEKRFFLPEKIVTRNRFIDVYNFHHLATSLFSFVKSSALKANQALGLSLSIYCCELQLRSNRKSLNYTWKIW